MRIKSRFEEILYIHLNGNGKKLLGYELLSSPLGKMSNEKLFSVVPDTIDKMIFLSHMNTLRERGIDKGKFFFVNIKPETLLLHHEEILSSIPFGRVVFEVREDYLDKEKTQKLKELRQEYQFLLSIDDFGVGASNFDRVKILEPNFVKIEVPLFTESELIFLSAMLKKTAPQAYLIAEKVETEEELKNVLDAGFELCQGWLFSKQSHKHHGCPDNEHKEQESE